MVWLGTGPMRAATRINGAQERTRTFTALRPLAPEASASTNSATWALLLVGTSVQGLGRQGLVVNWSEGLAPRK